MYKQKTVEGTSDNENSTDKATALTDPLHFHDGEYVSVDFYGVKNQKLPHFEIKYR